MNDNSTDTELLIHYLDGELKPDEAHRLEKRLEAEDALRETLSVIRATRHSIRTYGIRNQVAGIRSDMLTERRRVRRLYPAKWGLRIAGVFLVVLAIEAAYQYVRLTPERLYKDNFDPFTTTEVRGVGDSLSLITSYTRNDPARVIELFGHLAQPSADDYFLTGNAWLALKQPDSAIHSFLSVQAQNIRHNTHQYQEDTEYYLAMSYLAAGHTADAIPLFEKIYRQPAHLYHDNVNSWFIRKLHWLH